MLWGLVQSSLAAGKGGIFLGNDENLGTLGEGKGEVFLEAIHFMGDEKGLEGVSNCRQC